MDLAWGKFWLFVLLLTVRIHFCFQFYKQGTKLIELKVVRIRQNISSLNDPLKSLASLNKPSLALFIPFQATIIFLLIPDYSPFSHTFHSRSILLGSTFSDSIMYDPISRLLSSPTFLPLVMVMRISKSSQASEGFLLFWNIQQDIVCGRKQMLLFGIIWK